MLGNEARGKEKERKGENQNSLFRIFKSFIKDKYPVLGCSEVISLNSFPHLSPGVRTLEYYSATFSLSLLPITTLIMLTIIIATA